MPRLQCWYCQSRDNRKKMRRFIEKEHMLWYSRRDKVYIEDINGEKQMSIIYTDA